jgi:hypothetical protein
VVGSGGGDTCRGRYHDQANDQHKEKRANELHKQVSWVHENLREDENYLNDGRESSTTIFKSSQIIDVDFVKTPSPCWHWFPHIFSE